MFIQHNISAINSKRNLNVNQNKLRKNLERLSSGYRINRAGDDAAGLAISEALRSDIGGTDQAVKNAQDGIGMIQTAEGAMEEIHSMLQRANTLSLASLNGTYTHKERLNMQEEFKQIREEISRITEHTEFNRIPLLQGKAVFRGEYYYTDDQYEPVPNSQPVLLSPTAGEFNRIYEETVSYKGSTYTIRHTATFLDFSGVTNATVGNLDNTGLSFDCPTCDKQYIIKFESGSSTATMTADASGGTLTVGLDNINTGNDLLDRIMVLIVK